MKMIKRLPADWPERGTDIVAGSYTSKQSWAFVADPMVHHPISHLPPSTFRSEGWFIFQSSAEQLFRRAAAEVHQRIEINPKILGGAPCISGTRIPVYAILELFEAGYNKKKILKSFPSLSQDALEAALRFSAIVMER